MEHESLDKATKGFIDALTEELLNLFEKGSGSEFTSDKQLLSK